MKSREHTMPDIPFKTKSTVNEPCYYGKKALIEIGWTEGLINQHLATPDFYMRNNHNRSGPPIRCFYKQRVDALMKGSGIVAAMAAIAEHRPKRSRVSQGVAAEKRARLVREMHGRMRSVPLIPFADLYRSAIGKDPTVSENAITEYEARHIVNHLRHSLEYDDACKDLIGAVGREVAYQEMRQLIMDDISDKYPYLSTEVTRQEGQQQLSFL